ncbi:MAG: hypothetical protein HC805_05145 [Alkalinema sp. RL_2_19]|nr:hypothetical protein [Alkalinema sp. RL_2_19]
MFRTVWQRETDAARREVAKLNEANHLAWENGSISEPGIQAKSGEGWSHWVINGDTRGVGPRMKLYVTD